MRLSARARYAVRLMVEITQRGGKDHPVQLSKVSQATGISRKFLEQLAIALRNQTLLRGICGRKGGYVLAAEPEAVTLRQIVTAAVGPISLSVCVEDPLLCMSADLCGCRTIWALMQQRIDSVLDGFTLADLVNPEKLAAVRLELEDESVSPREDELPLRRVSPAPACAVANTPPELTQ